jgi:hypothetical protein
MPDDYGRRGQRTSLDFAEPRCNAQLGNHSVTEWSE